MNIEIRGSEIKVGQLLKKIGEIQTGGAAAVFLNKHVVKVNGKRTVNRGAKVRDKDIVWIDEKLYKIVSVSE
ncbi:RNA-binding S4 domain-containing protein [Mycoplasmopsis agassizii]|uniref:RNA-binding S4 domain-containing protein n=1 Tax=Mycoplasmopsis agassizii TaxID=33922 RepID=UPI00352821C7